MFTPQFDAFVWRPWWLVFNNDNINNNNNNNKISRSSEVLSLWCFIMQMQHCSLKHKEHFLFIWSLKNWTLSQAQLSQTVDWWLHTKPAVPTVAQKADGQTGMLNKHSQSVVSSFYMVLVQCKKIFKTTFLLFNKFIIRGSRVWFRWIAIVIVSLKNSFEKALFLLTKLLRSAWIKLYVPQIATRWQQKHSKTLYSPVCSHSWVLNSFVLYVFDPIIQIQYQCHIEK